MHDFDSELILYEHFIKYFTQDQNHLIQVFDRESPMRCVFRFGTVLTKTIKKNKSSDDSGSDKNVNDMVDQVLRDSMLDPSTKDILSDDIQDQFIRDSIEATIKLEINNDKSKNELTDQD